MNTEHSFRVMIVAFLAVAVGAGGAAAQSAAPSAEAADLPRELYRTTTITAQPASEAQPALRYHLLPTLLDQTDGNAMLQYYLAQQVAPDRSREPAQQACDRIEELLDVPIDEIDPEEAAALIDHFRDTLGQIEIGSLRADAAMDLHLEQGYGVVLPSLGEFRLFARVLSLRARVAIAQGRYDDALATIRTGMAMGQHIAEAGPTVINAMVGIAIESLMLDRLAEWIDAGGANLYWALAELPRPLVDPQPALAAERLLMQIGSPEFRQAAEGQISAEAAGRLLENLPETIGHIGPDGPPLPQSSNPILVRAAMVTMHLARGRQWLLDNGRSAEQVEQLQAAQIVALYLVGDYVDWNDRMHKWFQLPYWQARQPIRQCLAEFREADSPNPLFYVIPALERSLVLQARLGRQIAALQTIEALRHHAATHDQLPNSLDELELPAPIDPITGRLMLYQHDGNRFTLIGEIDEDQQPRDGDLYEVTLEGPLGQTSGQ